MFLTCPIINLNSSALLLQCTLILAVSTRQPPFAHEPHVPWELVSTSDAGYITGDQFCTLENKFEYALRYITAGSAGSSRDWHCPGRRVGSSTYGRRKWTWSRARNIQLHKPVDDSGVDRRITEMEHISGHNIQRITYPKSSELIPTIISLSSLTR